MIKQFKTPLVGILFCLIALYSCKKSNKDALPAGILSHQEMVDVLTDIHLMETAINLQITTNNCIYTDRNKLRENVFIFHRITTLQFNKSYQYYNAHPDKLDKIYQDVVTELSEKQAKNNTN